MGIYVLEPEALSYIPSEGYFDFPDLVQALLRAREPVGALRFDGLWFDIGRRDDYEQAVATWLAASAGQNGNGHANGKANAHVDGVAGELLRQASSAGTPINGGEHDGT
jgi:NDP-sugar pyrophosphorylase family protein